MKTHNTKKEMKTECPKGHKYDIDNAIVSERTYQDGTIYIHITCRTCHNERQRRKKEKLGKPKYRTIKGEELAKMFEDNN